MRHIRKPPPDCPEREELKRLLRLIWQSKRAMWHLCVKDGDWSKQMFVVSLQLEGDSRFNFWFNDLLEKAQVPWSEIE